jgi:predicted ATPase
MYEAELCHGGESSLMEDAAKVPEVAQCFHVGIEVARRQSVLELRATMSLARLRERQDRHDEGPAMLADFCDWFTECFDTADLKDAQALLDELAG